MSTKPRATLADLAQARGKAELVNGELVLMSPTGADPNYAALAIALSLHAYARREGRGRAVGDNAGFLVNLPHRQSFSPDAAYYTGPLPGMKFFPAAPVFAVEVRSEGDYGPAAEKELAAKRADYFAAGTLVVWDVDLQSADVVRVDRAGAAGPAALYGRGAQAEAEPAVPGWTLAVDELFAGRGDTGPDAD